MPCIFVFQRIPNAFGRRLTLFCTLNLYLKRLYYAQGLLSGSRDEMFKPHCRPLDSRLSKGLAD